MTITRTYAEGMRAYLLRQLSEAWCELVYPFHTRDHPDPKLVRLRLLRTCREKLALLLALDEIMA